MAEADAEDRHPPHEPAYRLHAAGEHLGIAGAVGEEDAVGAAAGPHDAAYLFRTFHELMA